MIKSKKLLLSLLLAAGLVLTPTATYNIFTNVPQNIETVSAANYSSIPKYEGKIYTVINDNKPYFTDKEKKNTSPFEKYSKLDKLGRCGVAYANICKELQPTEPRGDISSVHPSGWQSRSGWERCHLIGFQLAGENANEKNLVTGTHDFNYSGMLPFENKIDDYVDETGNHVLYRVTPVFKDKNLVCSGVYMEAWSVEDNGKLCFNIFVHNVTPGKTIDYKRGCVSGVTYTQFITLKKYFAEFSYSKTKNKACTFNISPSVDSGNSLCVKKVSGSSNITINKAGKVTLKKGTKKGLYKTKISVTASGDKYFKEKTYTTTITVKVNVSSYSSKNITVYWTANGSVYHLSKTCSSLSKSKNILSGSISDSQKPRACKLCS